MKKIPASLQLYSLRALTKDDFAGVAGKVAAIGFAGVETAGYGNLDAAGAASALTAAGLKCSGQHVGIAALRADISKVACEALLLGTRNIICPYFPQELLTTAAAAIELGKELDEIGARLRGYGLQLHYHNHAGEIAVVENHRVFDWLLDAAAPRNLLCEADVYWLHVGGKSPSEFLREQGRRVRLLHLKDEKELGTGPVDFAPIFEAIDSIGALEWQVVEVEKYNYDPLESVRLSFEKLKEWGRI
jgi:sugar phosphate isomerase/epimerase